MRLSDLKIDAEKKQNGVWIPVEDLKASFKVRGVGNYDWLAVEERETRSIRLAERVKDRLPPALQRQVLISCILEAGLLDWKGVTDDDDKDIPFSKERADEVLRDPDFGVLVDVIERACQAAAFASSEGPTADAEDEVKN